MTFQQQTAVTTWQAVTMTLLLKIGLVQWLQLLAFDFTSGYADPFHLAGLPCFFVVWDNVVRTSTMELLPSSFNLLLPSAVLSLLSH